MKQFACALGLVALVASTGRADSLALIARPLTLAPGTVDLSLRGDVFNFNGRPPVWIGTSSDPDARFVRVGYDGTGTALAAGVDVGVAEGLQVGLEFGLPLAPDPSFGTILANGSWRLADVLALRLDAGFVRATTNYYRRSIPTGAFGVGLPLKVRLSSNFALVSGSTNALGFGRFCDRSATSHAVPLPMAPASLNTFSLSLLGGGDLLNYVVLHDEAMRRTQSYLVFNLPVGLLYQPHERIALTLRGSYSVERWAGGGVRSYLPVGLEAVVAAVSQLDVGASFFLLGQVSGRPSPCQVGLDCAAGYAGTRLIALFANARF